MAALLLLLSKYHDDSPRLLVKTRIIDNIGPTNLLVHISLLPTVDKIACLIVSARAKSTNLISSALSVVEVGAEMTGGGGGGVEDPHVLR